MNFKVLSKNRVLKYPVLFLFIINFSCISIYKKYTGFSSPKVLSDTQIIKYKDKIFGKDSILDFQYAYSSINQKDTAFIIKVFEKSFNGNLNAYNNKGEKYSLDGISCVTYQIDTLQTFEEYWNISKKENLFSYLDSLKQFDTKIANNFYNHKSKMYIVYYWSSYIQSSKRIKNDFDNLTQNFPQAQIIRINCDFNSSWGLIHQAKIPIKFIKKGPKLYGMQIKSIPWKNN